MIAIKGMEMPTSCKECMLNNVDSPWFGLCRTTGNNVIEYKDSRHPNCPLTEIVTCKDCKNYKHHGINGYCSKRVNTDSNIDVYREPDYFCALGERKE